MLLAGRIKGIVKQQCWGAGRYRDAGPLLRCVEEVLTSHAYKADVQVFVTPWGDGGCHLHTKVLVKMGSRVYPLILSETCEPNLLAMTQNDITYLLVSVIEETEEEIMNLMSAGVELLDPLAVLLGEHLNDNYLDIRE